jgi:hypothetical protein
MKTKFPPASGKFARLCALMLLFASVLSVPILAQVTESAIHGTVTDTTGAAIPGAKVTALNTSTGIAVVQTTNNSGYYVFTALQPGGPYTVTVEAAGFDKFAARGITLIVNANWDADAKLKVGSNQQSVTVDASAVQVETSNTQLEQVATAEQLEGIPLEGRDPDGLQKLQPGVVESSDRTGAYSSNGNQTAQNSYLLNGTDINDGPLQSEGIQINPDALQEENIVTSTMNPEFARNSGSAVNQILKSGTNHLHGSGFEFYRDTFMNDRAYFAATQPVFHQNLYGGTLGGPVLKNKLFFFLGYQGLRARTGQTTVTPTLTSDQFNGNFTADPNYANGNALNSAGLTNKPIPFNIGSCIADPTAAQPETWAQCFSGANGQVNVPTSEWNPIAAKLINTYVPPANFGSTDNYNFNALNTNAQDQGILRFDYTPSSRDSIWASMVFQSSPSFNTLAFGGATLPGFGQIAAEHFKILSGSWTHTFSANLLNELHGGYYRFNFPAVIPSSPSQPSALGFAITPQSPLSGVPFMTIGTSFIALGNSPEGPQPRIDSNLTYADNFTWIRGNHSIKLGGSFEQFRVHNTYGSDNNGSYSFEGGGTYSSGDPLLDFALGIPDSYTQTSDGFIDAVAVELYAYAQDNWKVSSDFTFNYGIGWDAEGPNQNRQAGGLGITCWQNSNSTSNVFPGGPPGLSWPGDPGCNSAGGPTTHYNRFAPRIGFAWSPSSGPSSIIGKNPHDFSVRAGFGVYYNRDMEEQSLQNLADPPFFFSSSGAANVGGSPGFANPFTDVTGNAAVSQANPFPYATPHVGQAVNWSAQNELGLAAFSPSYSIPYTYNYQLTIDRALGGNIIARVGYVGSVSHRLSSWGEGDFISPANHAACVANPACLGDPDFVHRDFPQYTAQPAVVPGTTGTGSGQAVNGIPWYTSVADQTTDGSSNYNSLQVSVIKAPSHGLQFTVAYTYSHALDDFSGYESSFGGEASGYGSFGRVRNYVPGFEYLNYGSSDFDARHRLSTSYVYTVPVLGFMRSNVIAREALGGWGLSGVTALQSGNPVGISYGTPNSNWCDLQSYFGCGDVPETSSFNIARYQPRSKPAGNGNLQYFDTTPFSPEPAGTFGNTTRNFFRGPGFNYTNLSLTKNIHVTADNSKYIQLRLEAFNAFNHANFQSPSGIYLSQFFGQISNVVQSAEGNGDPSPARSVQLAGKFYF